MISVTKNESWSPYLRYEAVWHSSLGTFGGVGTCEITALRALYGDLLEFRQQNKRKALVAKIDEALRLVHEARRLAGDVICAT